MKRIVAMLIAGVAVGSVNATPVAESTARLAGKTFMSKHTQGSIAEPVLLKSYLNDAGTHPAFFVYGINDNKGFVIISGDDAVRPVLGYSAEDAFNTTNISPEVSYWLEKYRLEINDIMAAGTVAGDIAASQWKSLVDPSAPQTALRATAVAPLVATKWDQGTYYNDLCPGSGATKAPTGCVATAMAQIMKYWNAPTEGTGSYSYTHGTYGSLSANFGETSYDWGAMPNTLNGTSPSEAVSAVATLMYHCGVGVRMDYAPEGSGAQVIGWGTYPSARKAFVDYFGYKSTIEGVYREDYTTSEWIDMLKDQIDNGKPVLVAGFDYTGGGAGHAFVFSGYDDENMFHINWGWSGYYNGYFAVDDLNPDGTGIGGGSGSYNDGMQALINIEPNESGAVLDINLGSAISISASDIEVGAPFTVSATIANTGTMSFLGKYAAAIFNSDSTLKLYMGTTPEAFTEAGDSYDAEFSTTGMPALETGNYFVKILYRPNATTAWNILPDHEGFVNRINFTVGGGVTGLSELDELSGLILLYPNPTQNQLTVDVKGVDAKIKSLSIVNVAGARLYSTGVNTDLITIPVSQLASGVYFLNLQSDKGNLVRRFVVK